MTPAKQPRLAVECYRLMVAHTDMQTIAAALEDKGASNAEIEAAFTAAHAQLLSLRGFNASIEYARALAAYDLIIVRSFHVNDYKTAKSALDSKVKLLDKLEND